MNSNLSRIIAVFCSVTLMSMTVYGGTERIDNDKESNVRLGKIDDSEINNALQPFADASHIEENRDIEVFMEVNEFNYGGKISNIETFTFRQTKYVPLRTVANFLGREVSYDASSERIDITDNNVETLAEASALLDRLGFLEVRRIQAAVSLLIPAGRYHRMEAQNPVFLLSGRGPGA